MFAYQNSLKFYNIQFLPSYLVDIAESYRLGGQGSLKTKEVQDLTKNKGQ